jgi:hypothetical protein
MTQIFKELHLPYALYGAVGDCNDVPSMANRSSDAARGQRRVTKIGDIETGRI